jgi:hypothetical protein
MKKVMAALVVVAMMSGAAMASPAWQQIDFTNMITGAVSYDESGDNVVVSGTAFYQTIRSGGYLGTQLVGGDGIDLEVKGNFAMYAVVQYDTTDAGILANVMSKATTLFAYEIRTWGVKLDFDGNGTSDFTEGFTLNAPAPYLAATYAEIDKWGYTEMIAGSGIWFDLAVDTVNYPGYAAISVVIDGFSNDAWNAAFADGFNAMLLAGALQGPSNNTPGSGFRVAEVPEPASMILLGLGGLFCARRKK